MDKNLLSGLFAFVLWGLFPLYFKMLSMVSPWETLAHRIIWSFIFTLLIFCLLNRKSSLSKLQQFHLDFLLKNYSQLIKILLASSIITTNWFIFILAVDTDRVLETSLGYFISPLITILVGIIILREKTSLIKIVALMITVLAVSYKIYAEGNFSWISISLAGTFSSYALIKKKITLHSSITFLYETFFMLFPAIIYLSFRNHTGRSFLNRDLTTDGLLIGLGMVTTIPILLFHYSVKRTKLNLFGFIQYLTPSISFLLAIFIYDESFTRELQIVFTLIWFSIFLVGLDRWKGKG